MTLTGWFQIRLVRFAGEEWRPALVAFYRGYWTV